ncbi:hypothetical protein GCM10022402_43720 [Salinactinospora qingdaonensis]|uniref:Uncharacterized protein n=1 Tax=Salinactinospora qingdaonensis TaxID=702744 RepID=A0ABP7GFW1_9ACTN
MHSDLCFNRQLPLAVGKRARGGLTGGRGTKTADRGCQDRSAPRTPQGSTADTRGPSTVLRPALADGHTPPHVVPMHRHR